KSFFQTNTSQSLKMYRIAKEFAGLTGNETVYDLYTGTGTIALFMASGAKKVIGIEYVPEAIEDALFNAENNGIKNARFFAGDMKDILKPSFIEDNGIPDVLILDPPRAGIHPDVAKVIVEANPSIIVYISCNPATQARDLAMMSHQYRITNVQPLDMFPHTHHLENIVRLERKPYGNF
ncbi:MAG: 23S rRNA (uracil(1939)-C(5))-methyltransferase RlmD, partial [Bacteroidales bacterium]|nr:23S rRNA (uracil(1939)-C(5))-methyltransferase RlmD [Bacteroidales bacterium]